MRSYASVMLAALVAAGLANLATAAGTRTESVHFCDEESIFGSDGETCLTVDCQNGPGSPPASSQNWKVKYANGTEQQFPLGSGDGTVRLCNVTEILVHETVAADSTATVSWTP